MIWGYPYFRTPPCWTLGEMSQDHLPFQPGFVLDHPLLKSRLDCTGSVHFGSSRKKRCNNDRRIQLCDDMHLYLPIICNETRRALFVIKPPCLGWLFIQILRVLVGVRSTFLWGQSSGKCPALASCWCLSDQMSMVICYRKHVTGKRNEAMKLVDVCIRIYISLHV